MPSAPLESAPSALAVRHAVERFGAATALADARALRRRAESVLSRLGAAHIDPRSRVAELPLADRQFVGIGHALAHDPRVLILGEETSALARAEVVKRFELLRRPPGGTGLPRWPCAAPPSRAASPGSISTCGAAKCWVSPASKSRGSPACPSP